MALKTLILSATLACAPGALAATFTLNNECACTGAALRCTITLERDDAVVFGTRDELRMDRGTPDACSDYLVKTIAFDGLRFDVPDDQADRDVWELLPGLDRPHFCYAAGGSNMACDLDLTAYLLVNDREGVKASDVLAFHNVFVAGIDPALSGAADMAAYAALGSKTGLYGTVALAQRSIQFRQRQ